ncbi:MAG: MFS transporter [Alphaproteobacteria bacterium]|nr:MFS transporter [Alphaproteobacteria bacterium]
MSQGRLAFLAVAGAVVTANAYYIHPIIGVVARDLNVDAATIGLVPALNQIALALGILLLLPLGDTISNRTLVAVTVAMQCFATLIMALAPNTAALILGSTMLGFATVAPYLLPAYVSKRVEARMLGRATAWLTSGVIAGVLMARGLAGPITELIGWRAVYFMASALLAGCAIVLPRAMDKRETTTAPESDGYLALLRSLLPIVKDNPDAVVSGVIQAMNFGVFLAIWLGLGLYLTSPEMGYGAAVVSYLALLSGLNLLTTARLGLFADRIGAKRARVIFLSLQLSSVLLFFVAGNNLWWMIGPILLNAFAGPVIDVTGRMTVLSRAPEIRTRLMTVYIVLMFLGAGVVSWLATAAYEVGGWHANIGVAATLSSCALVLALWSLRRGR